MKKLTIATLACLILAPFAFAQKDIRVVRGSGGAIQTDLGYGISVNANSSLEREWITVNDSDMPAQFGQHPRGLTTRYNSDDRGYRYHSTFELTFAEPVTAVEVRFITFDIWGNHMRNFSFTEIADYEAGSYAFKPEWRAGSENEISRYYASIAYVSRVRTATGHVVEASEEPVLMEAAAFSESFTASDLEDDN